MGTLLKHQKNTKRLIFGREKIEGIVSLYLKISAAQQKLSN